MCILCKSNRNELVMSLSEKSHLEDFICPEKLPQYGAVLPAVAVLALALALII